MGLVWRGRERERERGESPSMATATATAPPTAAAPPKITIDSVSTGSTTTAPSERRRPVSVSTSTGDETSESARSELFAPKKVTILDKFFSSPAVNVPPSSSASSTTPSTSGSLSSSPSNSGGISQITPVSTSTSGTTSPRTSTRAAPPILAEEDIDEPDDIELNFDDLDITTEDPDFGELAELIEKFQEDARVKEVLLQGVDMRTYSLQIEQDLSQLEREGINDLIDASENIVELHDQLEECDSILATMEQLLEKFQNDLGNINTEIKILQDQSSSMSVRVKNRREVGTQISEFIDQLYISKELDNIIMRGNVDEQYVESIMLLHDKLKFVTQDKHRNLRCCQDSFKQLERLRLKAVEKIKKFFHEEFRVLRKPQVDISQIQSETLLKYKFFMLFLRRHALEVAGELRDQYISTVSEIYLSNSKYYISAMTKLNTPVGSRHDLLGASESSLKSFFTSRLYEPEPPLSAFFFTHYINLCLSFSLFNLLLSTPTKGNVFTLGNRDGILSYLDAPLIIPSEGEKKGLTLTYEAIFRSLNHYILETSSSEYRFLHDFFGPKTNIFHQIFDPILAMFLEAYHEYVKESYDAMGILIMIRIARESMKTMQDRKIPVLKSYFEKMAATFWPRFEHIFKMHLESVRSASPSDLGSIDHHPHYVIRRYSEFAAGVASLRITYSDGRLIKLRGQMMKLIERLAVQLSKSLSDARLQCVFLINNYHLIISLL